MAEQKRRIVIKIGSNVLTDAAGKLDKGQLASLVEQIVTLQRAKIEVIVVTSGAVAAGRSDMAGQARKLDTISQRQLFSAVGQVQLINQYDQLLQSHGAICGQVLTTKEAFATRSHYLNQQHCIGTMLECGVTPIINENDTVAITELMFTDNDELSGLVATMMDADTLIILSNIDGIFSGDPADPTAQVIREVGAAHDDLTQYISSSKSQYGRGGMLTKCRIATKVAAQGIEVIIACGKRPNILTDLLLTPKDTISTRFVAAKHGTSSIKRWIAHSDGFAKGVVRINANAHRALTSSATSLLPIGVVSIEGEFERGDIVKVTEQDGSPIGIGRISVDSNEARATAGERGHKPIIHYDYLYIDEL